MLIISNDIESIYKDYLCANGGIEWGMNFNIDVLLLSP